MRALECGGLMASIQSWCIGLAYHVTSILSGRSGGGFSDLSEEDEHTSNIFKPTAKSLQPFIMLLNRLKERFGPSISPDLGILWAKHRRVFADHNVDGIFMRGIVSVSL